MKILSPGQCSNLHREFEAVKLTTRALRAMRFWDKHAL
jgi:hypothetical protein